MAIVYTVPLALLIKQFKLEEVYLPKESSKILISNVDVSRPGLQLAGFFDVFDVTRTQIMGKTEMVYLSQFDDGEICARVEKYFSYCPPVVIVTRNLEIFDCMKEAAKRYGVPLLRTAESTSAFMAGLIGLLNVELAPRTVMHGVLLEVYGEGVLLLGESGVGKSETAIELIKRGHRLIADDAVEVRRVSAQTIVGTSPENIRHFLELRGVGIINARRLFGMGAVKMMEKVDMIIKMEQWESDKIYDRMGMNEEFTEVLGNKITSLTIPIKPGRNLAIIIEVAAMNNRQKKMGYNAAEELLAKLGMAGDQDDINARWGY